MFAFFLATIFGIVSPKIIIKSVMHIVPSVVADEKSYWLAMLRVMIDTIDDAPMLTKSFNAWNKEWAVESDRTMTTALYS